MNQVIERLQQWVKEGLPIPPGLWVDEAMKLLVFYGEQSDLCADLESEVAKSKWNYRKEHSCSDAEAESYKRTLDVFKQFKKQEGTVKMLDEYIRLAKKRATLADNELKY